MASNNLRSSSPALSTYSDNTQKIRRDTAAVGMAEKVPLVVINDNYLDENIEDSLPKHDIDDIPMMMSRAGFDGEGDNLDDNKKPQLYPNGSGRLFPYPPGLRYGTETGSILPDGESLPDVNIYQQKKTLAKGMMDLALFSANVNQLRYVLQSSSKHPYYYPSLVFISISLIFQIAVGIGLTWNATYNVRNKKEICIANKINNFTVIGIFIVTAVNVFISAFCVANTPTV